jgi:hypothetical protein
MVFHFMAQARMQQILCVVLDWSRWGILIFMKAKDIDNMGFTQKTCRPAAKSSHVDRNKNVTTFLRMLVLRTTVFTRHHVDTFPSNMPIAAAAT